MRSIVPPAAGHSPVHAPRALAHPGVLRFSTLEPVLRAVVDAGDELLVTVLDFKRVNRVDAAVVRMTAEVTALEARVLACRWWHRKGA